MNSKHQTLQKSVIDRTRFRKVRRFFFKTFLQVVWWDFFLNRPLLRVFRSRALPRWRKVARDYRELALEMGGVMIKLGQFLSVRVDMLPREVTDELSCLQDRVESVPFEKIIPYIEQDLGRPMAELFRSVSHEPIGAASLAQVYKAQLHSGETVAVKSLRPGIEVIVESDLAAITKATQWLKFSRYIRKRVDLDHFAEEFASVTRRELDLKQEADNTERFSDSFAEDLTLYVPRIYRELSSSRTLTAEYVGFIKLDDRAAMQTAGIEPGKVAQTLYRSYMEQIFNKGYVHVDPHQGNLFIKPNPSSKGHFQLVFIDFGMMAEIPGPMRSALTQFAIGVGTRNAPKIIDAYQRGGILLPGADKERLVEATHDLLERFSDLRLGDIRSVVMSEARYFVDEYRDLVYSSPMQFPVDLLFVMRSVGMLSGLATRLDPNFSPWSETIPFAAKLAQSDVSRQYDDLLLQTYRKLQKLSAIPDRMERVLQQFDSGNIAINSNLTPKSLKALRSLEHSQRRSASAITGVGLLIAGIQLPEHGYATGLSWLTIVAALMLLLSSVRRPDRTR